MLTHISDFNQAAIVVLIGFSIGFLGRRFAALMKFIVDKVVPTNFYYVLEFGMVFALALAGWTLIELIPGFDLPFAGVVVVAGLLAGANTYHRLLRETGCPGCKTLTPFRRQERQRRKIRGEETQRVTRNYSRFDLSLRKPYIHGERSWESVTTTVHHVYNVRYRCASCRHEWEIEEPRFVSRREEQRDLPPGAFRPGRRDS